MVGKRERDSQNGSHASPVRVLLVSTYDLGRQPFGLASPMAWLQRAGIEATCIDGSRERVTDQHLREASLVGFYLPMHTATRLAGPLIARTRRVNPAATLVAYGLYAPLNREWLLEEGVTHVLGPEAEEQLVAIATEPDADDRAPREWPPLPRLAFIQPSRTSLPLSDRYARLQMPDGTSRLVGSTDATRGCKHLCRHCPIVPVYNGTFRAVPVDVVIADIRAQVAAGVQHISFGDPDFLNGPTHARRIVERCATEFPHLTYDATIKIEHLLRHADLLPLLKETGCLFITSAVESIDDDVLAQLRKGHSRADFFRAVALCREAGVTLSPTFVPFTPWTTLHGYVELLTTLDELGVVEQVAPIQLAIRLLVTAGSPLLELPEIHARVEPFDRESLIWPWRHADPRVDELHSAVMRLVGTRVDGSRSDTFDEVMDLARAYAGMPGWAPQRRESRHVPYLNEPWYCCAEPRAEDLKVV